MNSEVCKLYFNDKDTFFNKRVFIIINYQLLTILMV